MKKYALLAILMAMLLVTPAFAFWHPPPPDIPDVECLYFGVMIEGEWAPITDPFLIEEPDMGYCDTFIVEVWVANAVDLYGYEFSLGWHSTYFALESYVIAEVWPSQFVVKPEATYDLTSPYKQVVAAMAPSTGVSGNFLLATLTFHIINDVCYLQEPYICGMFQLTGLKASNSCSEPIQRCDPVDGYWKFVPVKPKVWIDPAEEVNSKIGEKFTITVWVENIVKLHDFDITVTWHGFHVVNAFENFWTALIATDPSGSEVVINDEVFPADNSTQTVVVNSPALNTRFFVDPVGTVRVVVTMDPGYPLINGTFWMFSITFTKGDPWWCGAQPQYTPLTDHDWDAENATTDITLSGWLSVLCPDPGLMYLGVHVDVENSMFTFDPIPGDLDGNGHVDIADIMIIAGYYGQMWPPAGDELPPNPYSDYYYDLNKSGLIDVYDIVIVAKNFCRTEP